MRRRTAGFLLFLLCIPGVAAAAPNGEDLLRACRQSLESGFQGVAGRMCEYYVTPCDCEAGRAADILRVCLPAEVSTKALARKVIDGLEVEPALQRRPAADAAARILSRDYPCDG